MRKALFEACFVVLVLSLAYCSKQNKMLHNKATQLLGTWELREAQSGMTPTIQYGAGNGYQYRFAETTYEFYTADSLVKSGTYRVVIDTAAQKNIGLLLPAGTFTSRIIFDNDVSAGNPFFDFDSGRLIMLSGFFPTDGGHRQVYEKTGTGR